MKITGKRIIQKVVAIFIIMMMTLSDFAIVGINAISYAIDMVATNSDNVEFSAYFINANKDKVTDIESNIDAKDLKMYVEIAVKQEGYLNGQITLENSSFNLKNESSSEFVKQIEGNTVTLNKINANNIAVIELGVEYNNSEKISVASLNQESTIKLTGTYVSSKKDKSITGETKLRVDWKSSDETKLEMTTKILTNSIHKVNDVNKKIVQVLVDSKLANNSYPVKTTDIELNVPDGVEEVRVHARKTDATSSDIDFGTGNYDYNTENKVLKINLSNKEANGLVNWKKNVADTIVITYLYDEKVDLSGKELTVKDVINTFDNRQLDSNTKLVLDEERNGVITVDTDNNENSIYKGKIYTGEDREYKTTTVMNVDYANVVDEVELSEDIPVYLYNKDNLADANVQYVQSKIKKSEFEKIFGENGTLEVLNQEGNTIISINKESQTDGNGYINIYYAIGVKSIKVKTSKPVSEGVLNIEHTKKLTDSKLSREEIRKVTGLKQSVEARFKETNSNIHTNKMSNTMNLKETTSAASIKLNKQKLSTITENKNIEIVATLETNDESKDLYKNPKINIVFPKEITNLNVQITDVYMNGLKIANKSQTKNSNGNIVLEIELSGEQKKYNSDLVNVEIHLYGSIVINKNTPTKDTKIEMNYTNENGKEDSYKVSTGVTLESQYGLMLYNKMEGFNSKGDILETVDDTKTEAKLNNGKENVTSKVTTTLINNYNKELKNIEIIGKLPSKIDDNTFNTEISNLNVENKGADIYYNTDINASSSDKSWNKDSKNAKAYKIIISSIESGEVVKITYNLGFENNIALNKTGTLTTTVNADYGESKIARSSNIVLSTEEGDSTEDLTGKDEKIAEGLVANISAISGNKELKDGDSIYEGETIKYIVKIKNDSDKNYNNINIKATQTNGKLFDLIDTEVTNIPLYGDKTAIEHYWGVKDTNIKEFNSLNIESGKTVTVEYQMVAQKGETTYSELNIMSTDNSLNKNITTIKNKIKNAKLKLMFTPGLSEECYWTSETVQQSNLYITNITDQEIKNIEVQISLSKEFDCDKYDNYIEWNSDVQATILSKTKMASGKTIIKLKIESIAAGKTAEIYVKPYISRFNGEKESVELSAKAIIENEEFTSNNIIRNVKQSRHNISISQSTKVNENIVNKDTKLNDGDKVEFDVSIKNNDKENVGLNVSDVISDGLTVQKITLTKDGKDIDITGKYNNKTLSYTTELSSKGEIKINIIAKVETIYLIDKEHKISNKVEVKDLSVVINDSNIVTLDVNVKKIDDRKLNVTVIQDSATKNKSIVKDGDNVEFAIKLKNTSDFDRKINIYDYLSSAIKEIKVYIANEDVTKKYLSDNDVAIENYVLKANEEKEIKIQGVIHLGKYTESSITNQIIVKSSLGDIKSNTITYYTSQDGKNNDNKTDDDKEKYTVSGIAWVDANENGKKDDGEELLKDIPVRAIDLETNKIVDTTVTTAEDGKYSLTLPSGKYIIIFMYNNENYYITKYKAKKVSEELNSDAVSKEVTIDNNKVTVGATDIIDLYSNKENINLGLIFRTKFDLKIEKMVTKMVVSNNKGTETHYFDNSKLAKVEIAAKYLSGSTVLVEYKIKVTNNGDIDGYVKNIVDYMPSDMTFSSNVNKDWYQTGKNLYNESIADKKLAPGESTEVTLVLTKSMTDSNTGLVNNTAEIKSSYNVKSSSDANKENNKDSADVAISVKTGAAIRLVLLTITFTVAIAGAAYYVTKKYINKKI